MKHWKYCAVAAVLAVLILSSCSTIKGRAEPKVHESNKVGEGIYTVEIWERYCISSFWGVYSKEQVKYAINQFVKSMGYESYGMKRTRKRKYDGRDNRAYAEYTVTIPGSIPVEDLPVMTIPIYR